MNADKVHEGRNVKRFREMLGLKQEALAYELGDDWTQKRVSLLEQKETIDHDVLEHVAKVLKVSPEAIKNFSEQAAINIICSTLNDNAGSVNEQANFNCTFNPLDKVVELYEENKTLYERMLKEKEELLKQTTELLKQFVDKK